MNELHVIIIDQSLNGIEELTEKLSIFHPEIIIDASATDIIKGIALIKQNQPKIVFFAITTDKQESCQLLEQIKPQNFKLIFLISNNHCHGHNCNLSPIDCISKPIQEEQLNKAIEKYRANKRNHKMYNKIIVPVGTDSRLIDLDEVICFVADNNYTNIHLTNGEIVQASITLIELETIVDSDDFIRIHRHSIINMKYYKLIHNTNECRIEQTNGMNLAISESGKKILINWLKRY